MRGTAQKGSSRIRTYKVPESVNLYATSCIYLIKWEEEVVTKPIFTVSLNTSELHVLLETPLAAPKYSLHTQHYERAVKSVTEAAKVCDWERRHRLVLAFTKHRKNMPKMKAKRQNMKVFIRREYLIID